MDNIVHAFNDELQSLLLSKPPVSKAKMGLVTKAAMKGVKFYKHIVQIVEKFIARCRPEYKVPGLYVIDSIVRQSRHQFGPERDVYALRFARNLGITFENLFSDCSDDDRSRMVRVLNLWLKNGVFDTQTIRPLLDMADKNTSNVGPRSPSSGGTNSSTKHDYATAAQPRYGSSAGDNALKFSKNMLDFDYDEDDDDDADETPTEAEPPLSSTLSKIEMEQRVKKATNENKGSKLGPRSAIASNLNDQSSHGRMKKTLPPNQDPVLERWNRIIKGELTGDQLKSDKTINNNNYQQQPMKRRSRSRSPLLTGDRLTQEQNYSLHKSTDQQSSVKQVESSLQILQSGNTGTPSKVIDPERAAERQRKCLPDIRDKHLTVCSSTLWLGHVPKNVSEADISDALGEFGTINSIDLIPPRGCAYVCMDRRQDAKRALSESKRLKLNGYHIKIAWAPGKGLKEQKKWKDYWQSDLGVSFVPYSNIDLNSIDFDTVEEGGVIDEDSMSLEMLEKREQKNRTKHGELVISNTAKSRGQTLSNHDDQTATPLQPIFNQPPPSSTNMQQFVVPPPPLNLGIPPPMLLSQGLMSYPPPASTSATLATASLGHIQMLNPSIHTSNASIEPRDRDQPFNMTERKINMVEQQLGMLQQAQGNQIINQPSQIGTTAQSLFYQFNQPDPLVFDYRHQQPAAAHMIHNMLPHMMDPHQMNMLEGQQPNHMMMRPPPMLPFDQQHPGATELSGILHDNYMTQRHEDF